jgi:hypothetical protein
MCPGKEYRAVSSTTFRPSGPTSISLADANMSAQYVNFDPWRIHSSVREVGHFGTPDIQARRQVLWSVQNDRMYKEKPLSLREIYILPHRDCSMLRCQNSFLGISVRASPPPKRHALLRFRFSISEADAHVRCAYSFGCSKKTTSQPPLQVSNTR